MKLTPAGAKEMRRPHRLQVWSIVTGLVAAIGIAPPSVAAETAVAGKPIQVAAVVPGNFWMFTEPQRTMVDVYYGGRLLVSTPARYTIDTVEFLDPGQIVEALPDTLAPSALLNHLQGEIPTNGEKVCVAPGQPDGCGKIEPDFIGVIFDETRFRADVFVHPELLAPPDPLAARYLPPPSSSDLSLVQGLSAVASDSSDGDALYGFYGQTWAGMGKQRAFSFWNSTDRSDFSVEQLAWQRDYPDHQLTAGLFESQFSLLRALRRDPIAGVGFRRSLDSRLDLEELTGGDIQVFLANRSQVDILRDGRLLVSRFYEAGNQRIDSSQLPPGAYNIELRITDAGGLQRTITRFFVKNALMAPANHPLYFAELGRVLNRESTSFMPEDAGTMLARGGYQWRYADAVGMSLAAAATEVEFLPEFGVVWIGDKVDVGAEIYSSTEGDHGAALRATYRWPTGTTSFLTQRNSIDPRPLFDTDYHLISNDSAYTSLSANQAFWHGQASGSIFRSESSTGEKADGWSLGYNRAWPLGPYSLLSAGADLGATEGDLFAELSLEWRFMKGNWRHSLKPIVRDSEIATRPDGASLEASSVWEDGERYIDELRAELRAIANEDLSTAALEGEYRSEYGMARAGAQTSAGNQDNTSISVMLDSNVIVADGEVGLGAPQRGVAGVILDLRGLPDSLFDVLVDGQRQFSTRGGRRVALPLPGYRTFNITLRDRGTSNFARFEQDTQQVTLYPGNAVTLTWDVEQIIVVLGRLFHEAQVCDELTGDCHAERQPAANAVLRSGKGIAVVEEDGFFQLELESSATQIEAEIGEQRCHAAIDTHSADNGVLRLPRLDCLPVTVPAAADTIDALTLPAGEATEPADDAGEMTGAMTPAGGAAASALPEAVTVPATGAAPAADATTE